MISVNGLYISIHRSIPGKQNQIFRLEGHINTYKESMSEIDAEICLLYIQVGVMAIHFFNKMTKMYYEMIQCKE